MKTNYAAIENAITALHTAQQNYRQHNGLYIGSIAGHPDSGDLKTTALNACNDLLSLVVSAIACGARLSKLQAMLAAQNAPQTVLEIVNSAIRDHEHVAA